MSDLMLVIAEWGNLAWYAAHRYKMPERGLDAEDLYQEALAGIVRLARRCPDEDLGADSMKSAVKNEIWRAVFDAVRPWLTEKRGYGKEIADQIASPVDEVMAKISDLMPDDKEANPWKVAAMREHVGLIKAQLSTDETDLLDELISPSYGTVVAYEVWCDSKKRRPSDIPLKVTAQGLGITYATARNRLRRVREIAREVMNLNPEKFSAKA